MRTISIIAAALLLSAPAAAGPFDDLGSAVEGGAGVAKTAPAGGVDAYRAKQAEADAAADALPLTAQVFTLVEREATLLGDYDPRGSNEYKASEQVVFYVEPIGVTFKKDGGLLSYGVSADLVLKDDGGNAIFTKEKFFALNSKTRTRRRDVYLTGSLGIKVLPPGQYTLELRFRDLNGGKTMTTSQPFKVIAPS